MEMFVGLLGLIVLIWFVLVLFNPGKFAPFFKSKPRLKALGCWFLAFVLLGMLAPEHTETTNETAQAETATTSSSTETKNMQSIEDANSEMKEILQNFYVQTDEVEKMTWYMPYQEVYPAETRLYWYAGVKEKHIWERAKMVHFSDDMDWVFWKKLIFSTDQGRWEYNLKTIIGQDGEKDTQIVMGGKYETADIPFDEIKPGIKLLITGTNPIIRLKGEKHHKDYYLSTDEIEYLKTGYRLSDLQEVTKNKIDL